MSRFPDRFLDDIRSRIRLSSVIGRHVRWDAGKSNPRTGDHWACCPFHHEKTPSFHAEDGKGRYHCFGCKASGDHFTFLTAFQSLSFREAVEQLARDAGLVLPEATPEDAARTAKQADLRAALDAAKAFFADALSSAQGDGARAYLAGRDISDDMIARFGLGLVPPARGALIGHLKGKGIAPSVAVEAGLAKEMQTPPFAESEAMRGRLVFPIEDAQGRVIGFGGRDLTGDAKAPKYLNTAETALFSKRHALYNFARAREPAREAGRAICVEGYVDVIACAIAGIGEAVAPLGTALSEEQLSLLWRLAPEPILAFDGDEAGRRAMRRAIDLALPLLKPDRSLGFCDLAGKDPDDIRREDGAEALRAAFRSPKPLASALWDALTSEADVTTPERRAAFQAAVAEAVGRIADEDVRAAYKAEFESRLKGFWRVRGLKAPGFKPPKPPKGGDDGGDDGRGGDDDAIARAIAQMNENFAVVLSGQKVAIALDDPDMALQFGSARFITPDAFHSWMANRTVSVARKSLALGTLWLQSKQRRQYHGVEFEPAPPGKDAGRPDWYNLWRGFAVEPRANPELAQPWFDHVHDTLAGGNQEWFDWIVSWFAGRIQNPRRRYGTSLVLRGGQGAGKTIAGAVIGRLIPSHFLLIDDSRYLTGQFNAHLATCLLIQADEGFWAGDKKTEGVLKGMITSERHMIEFKGVDPVPARNYLNLIITSNWDWVVPAGPRERRFAVFNVSDRHQQDHGYFGRLDTLYRREDAMAALLHALMAWKVDEQAMRVIPQTDALTEQKVESFDTFLSFLHELLADGGLTPGAAWPYYVECADLHHSYIRHCERRAIGRPLARETFGTRLTRVWPGLVRKRLGEIEGKRPWAYTLPRLTEARDQFAAHIGAAIDWGEIELEQGLKPRPPPAGDDGLGPLA